MRGLCSEHNVTGCEVRLILEGDGELTVESVPEGGTKPYSEAAVEQTVTTIHKAAGWTDLPDELVEDAGGVAEEIVASKFGRAVGRKIDVDLPDGTGRASRSACCATPTSRTRPSLRTRRWPCTATSWERWGGSPSGCTRTCRWCCGLRRWRLRPRAQHWHFLFPEGLAGKLSGMARVVPEANVPLAVGNLSPVRAGDFRQVLFFSCKSKAIDVNNGGEAFVGDVTGYRCVERYGTTIAKAEAFEVVDGVDLSPIVGTGADPDGRYPDGVKVQFHPANSEAANQAAAADLIARGTPVRSRRPPSARGAPAHPRRARRPRTRRPFTSGDAIAIGQANRDQALAASRGRFTRRDPLDPPKGGDLRNDVNGQGTKSAMSV